MYGRASKAYKVLIIQRTLLAGLQHTQQSQFIAGASWILLESASDNCRRQTLKTLNQLYMRLATTTEFQVPITQATGSNYLRSGTYPRNLCQSAIEYRENRASFADLTNPKSRASNFEWACISCKRTFSRASLSVAPEVKLWIAPSALFKSHCQGGIGWVCIWEPRTAECAEQFGTRRELLLHMKRAHVSSIDPVRDVFVDNALDLRGNDVDSCGYGIKIVGRQMLELGGRFIVPRAIENSTV